MEYNAKLNNARKSKMDEFFTEYKTIDNELSNYGVFFSGKTVYCNCDNPETSNFYKYFKNNFSLLGIKKLVCSWFDTNGGGICEYYDEEEHIKKLEFDGDFRNKRFYELINRCDVVVTNPPFSLFRDFIKLMMKHHKKFIVLGNLNAVKYKDIFPYIKSNRIFLGKSIHAGDIEFIVPDEFFDPEKTKNYRISEVDGTKLVRVPSIRWYTNVEFDGFNRYNLKLSKTYNPDEYPTYDNYILAINCNKVMDIPIDYYDKIGVPVNFIDKYDSEMFEIVDILRSPMISGRNIYDRFIIKRRQ